MIIIEGNNYPGVKILNSSRVTKYFSNKNLIVKINTSLFKNYSKDYRSLNIFPSKLLDINNSNAISYIYIGLEEMISIKR